MATFDEVLEELRVLGFTEAEADKVLKEMLPEEPVCDESAGPWPSRHDVVFPGSAAEVAKDAVKFAREVVYAPTLARIADFESRPEDRIEGLDYDDANRYSGVPSPLRPPKERERNQFLRDRAEDERRAIAEAEEAIAGGASIAEAGEGLSAERVQALIDREADAVAAQTYDFVAMANDLDDWQELAEAFREAMLNYTGPNSAQWQALAADSDIPDRIILDQVYSGAFSNIEGVASIRYEVENGSTPWESVNYKDPITGEITGGLVDKRTFEMVSRLDNIGTKYAPQIFRSALENGNEDAAAALAVIASRDDVFKQFQKNMRPTPRPDGEPEVNPLLRGKDGSVSSGTGGLGSAANSAAFRRERGDFQTRQSEKTKVDQLFRSLERRLAAYTETFNGHVELAIIALDDYDLARRVMANGGPENEDDLAAINGIVDSYGGAGEDGRNLLRLAGWGVGERGRRVDGILTSIDGERGAARGNTTIQVNQDDPEALKDAFEQTFRALMPGVDPTDAQLNEFVAGIQGMVRSNADRAADSIADATAGTYNFLDRTGAPGSFQGDEQMAKIVEQYGVSTGAQAKTSIEGTRAYRELYANRPQGVGDDEYALAFAQKVAQTIGAPESVFAAEAKRAGMLTGDLNTAVGRAANSTEGVNSQSLQGGLARKIQGLRRLL